MAQQQDVLQILGGLLKKGAGIGNVGEQIGMLGGALGAASTFRPGVEGEMTRIKDEIFGQAAETTLKKQAKDMAEKTLQEPQGTEALLAFLAKSPTNMNPEPPKDNAAGGEPTKQPDLTATESTTPQAPAGQESGLLNNLLQGAGNFLVQPGGRSEQGVVSGPSILGGLISEHPSVTLQRQQAFALSPEGAKMEAEAKLPTELAKEQAKAGVAFAKTQLKRRDEFFKMIDTPMSGEGGKSLSLVETALTQLDKINTMLGVSMDEQGNVVVSNAGALKNANVFNKNRQALQRARDIFVNKLLRRDSGAAITPEEMKEASRMYGFNLGNLKALVQRPEVIGQILLETKDQLTRDRNRLSPNQGTKDIVAALEGKGYSRDEIYIALSNRGLI